MSLPMPVIEDHAEQAPWPKRSSPVLADRPLSTCRRTMQASSSMISRSAPSPTPRWPRCRDLPLTLARRPRSSIGSGGSTRSAWTGCRQRLTRSRRRGPATRARRYGWPRTRASAAPCSTYTTKAQSMTRSWWRYKATRPGGAAPVPPGADGLTPGLAPSTEPAGAVTRAMPSARDHDDLRRIPRRPASATTASRCSPRAERGVAGFLRKTRCCSTACSTSGTPAHLRWSDPHAEWCLLDLLAGRGRRDQPASPA